MRPPNHNVIMVKCPLINATVFLLSVAFCTWVSSTWLKWLLSDFVCVAETEGLLDMLEQLSEPSRCVVIQRWDYAGSVSGMFLALTSVRTCTVCCLSLHTTVTLGLPGFPPHFQQAARTGSCKFYAWIHLSFLKLVSQFYFVGYRQRVWPLMNWKSSILASMHFLTESNTYPVALQKKRKLQNTSDSACNSPLVLTYCVCILLSLSFPGSVKLRWPRKQQLLSN